ncbi:MAG: putative bifunctional diguanylate cyclase/phosphodiesterase [Thermoanaerobaculia bacterium]
MDLCLVLSIASVAIGTAIAIAGVFWSRRERNLIGREVERLAFHDSLTGLPNRLLFMDRAAIAFANAKRSNQSVAVVFLDLDRFKLVNDSYGHNAGDDVLRGVANRLCDHLREGDTVARIGGDEFTLLIPGMRVADDVVTIVAKILDVIHIPLVSGTREVVVSASIGVSMYPNDGADAETLLKNADAAMYRVKQRGGDNFELYTPALDAHAREELENESRLRRALAREEFVVYYQPRVDIETRRVNAFEALLRWNDPDRGLLTPRDFMRSAEVSGLIVPIGNWVIETACRQARQWHEQGWEDIVVSVNLSPRQFQRPDLIRNVHEALRAADLEPQFLELEVDESSVMVDAEMSMKILRNLKSLGVRVLISHFGSGYSSLRYLRRFPIDGLKLERSFLLPNGGDNRPLATAALSMAKALRLRITGEGVETEEAADFLRSQSCDDIQGYLVSAAVPAQDCAQFLN